MKPENGPANEEHLEVGSHPDGLLRTIRGIVLSDGAIDGQRLARLIYVLDEGLRMGGQLPRAWRGAAGQRFPDAETEAAFLAVIESPAADSIMAMTRKAGEVLSRSQLEWKTSYALSTTFARRGRVDWLAVARAILDEAGQETGQEG